MSSTSHLRSRAEALRRGTDEGYLRPPRDLGSGYWNWHALLMTFSPVVGQSSLAYGGLRLPK